MRAGSSSPPLRMGFSSWPRPRFRQSPRAGFVNCLPEPGFVNRDSDLRERSINLSGQRDEISSGGYMPSPFPSGEGPPCAPVLRSRRRGSVRIDSSGPWAVPEGVKCPRERRADGVVTTLGPADLGHSYTGYKPGDKQKTHNHSRPPHRCRERLERGNEIPIPHEDQGLVAT